MNSTLIFTTLSVIIACFFIEFVHNYPYGMGGYGGYGSGGYGGFGSGYGSHFGSGGGGMMGGRGRGSGGMMGGGSRGGSGGLLGGLFGVDGQISVQQEPAPIVADDGDKILHRVRRNGRYRQHEPQHMDQQQSQQQQQPQQQSFEDWLLEWQKTIFKYLLFPFSPIFGLMGML